MINNNKGAILLVTIVSMMILTIIGYITLQMTASQGVTDTYDQARIRVGYAAEGIVERARGYIDYMRVSKSTPVPNPAPASGEFGDIGYNPNGSGILFSKVHEAPGGRWFLFEGVTDADAHYGVNGSVHDLFDSSIYPEIRTTVWCQIATETIKGIRSNGGDYSPVNYPGPNPTHFKMQTFKIVGIASATVNASGIGVIVSTVTYYFNMIHTVSSGDVKIHETRERFLAWRKEL